MGSWWVRRQLSRTSSRLRSLRSELAEIDEQVDVFASDADDHAVRALVSDDPAARGEASDARRHADAMARHRRRVVERIADLERRQDELLDRLGGR